MLEINKKEDIIIPFDKIGDDNWQQNTAMILQAVADNWGGEFIPKPISNSQIHDLETRLNTKLLARRILMKNC